MSNISWRDSLDTLHSSNVMQQSEKKDNEVPDPPVLHRTAELFLRAPQSGTVVFYYRNKRKVKASVSEQNRRSDPSVGGEGAGKDCTFLSHHVSHDMGAVESAMVIITLHMGCFSCFCFVLNFYFDVFEFVDFYGLGTCTLHIGCFSCFCFLLSCCYFDDYYSEPFSKMSTQQLVKYNKYPFVFSLIGSLAPTAIRFSANFETIVKRRTNRKFNRLFCQNRIVFSILKGMLKMISDALLSLGFHYERVASSCFVLREMDSGLLRQLATTIPLNKPFLC
ncbi:hypothetical protein P9112_007283 [Eukaryota sp. TZLM1-RC]